MLGYIIDRSFTSYPGEVMPRKPTQAPAARPLTAKARQTRAALLDAAMAVFSEQRYFSASVSAIVRRCGLSQGTFYTYFDSKEQVLLELTDRLVGEYWEQVRALPAEQTNPSGRLRRSLAVLLGHTGKYITFIRVLGDLELVDPVTVGYYDSVARHLRGLVRDLVIRGEIRPLDPNMIAYGLIGMVQFQFLDWGDEFERWPAEQAVDLILDLVCRGIDGPLPQIAASDANPTAAPAPEAEAQGQNRLTQGQKTRLDLFAAAERIFGRMGYNRANIADITREAGVALGTFYVHFNSKIDLLEGVIRHYSQQLRWVLRQASDACADRREAERRGMLAFYRFIRRHRELYRIVAESYAVSPQVSRWYYTTLASGYSQALRDGVAQGHLRDIPISFLVRALMGFNHMIGMKWLIWNSSPFAEVTPQLAEQAAEMVLRGLSPR